MAVILVIAVDAVGSDLERASVNNNRYVSVRNSDIKSLEIGKSRLDLFGQR